MHLNNYELLEVTDKVAAIFEIDSSKIFDQEDVSPEIVKGNKKMIPWGENNDLPELMLEKIRKSEVMNSNMLFNILVNFGSGLKMKMADGTPVTDSDVKFFFRRNNAVKYLLEQATDLVHFSFSITLLLLTKDGKKVARIKHKEAFHARFAENNKKGKIADVFFANWGDGPKDGDVQQYPVLDQDDPYWDLAVRMGLEEDPETGKKAKATADRIFAIVTRIPTPGHKYYPFPYYAAHFNSGWYDIGEMVPVAKKAKMSQGMILKYHVEFHQEYFNNLYEDEKLSDPVKQLARRKLEFNNIKLFLSGIENAGKVWYSGYFIDPNGKENKMIRITVIDKGKEGGDWIEDTEEVVGMSCYATSTHPSLIGAVPGKSKGSLSGSDKRELFTMKQSLQTAIRQLQLIPYQVTQEFNNWSEDIEFDIPHLMLTTLDQGTDAKEVTTINPDTDDS
ncbi:MAG: hypothetical protein QM503_03855 [Bacteroidota bacterium]